MNEGWPPPELAGCKQSPKETFCRVYYETSAQLIWSSIGLLMCVYVNWIFFFFQRLLLSEGGSRKGKKRQVCAGGRCCCFHLWARQSAQGTAASAKGAWTAISVANRGLLSDSYVHVGNPFPRSPARNFRPAPLLRTHSLSLPPPRTIFFGSLSLFDLLLACGLGRNTFYTKGQPSPRFPKR